jgi:hypothetical protein
MFWSGKGTNVFLCTMSKLGIKVNRQSYPVTTSFGKFIKQVAGGGIREACEVDVVGRVCFWRWTGQRCRATRPSWCGRSCRTRPPRWPDWSLRARALGAGRDAAGTQVRRPLNQRWNRRRRRRIWPWKPPGKRFGQQR